MPHGYKLMHLKCIQAGLVVTQTTIRHLLLILDPRGVQLRKRNRLRRLLYINPRPNFLWHVDSYDKLKPYGICINCAVDFPVWSYGYMLTPQVAIPVLFLATSLMKWNQFSERCYITGSSNHNPKDWTLVGIFKKTPCTILDEYLSRFEGAGPLLRGLTLQKSNTVHMSGYNWGSLLLLFTDYFFYGYSLLLTNVSNALKCLPV